MKQLFFTFLLAVACTGLSAQNASDIFESSETDITWLGLDFTHVKLIGSEGFSDPGTIRDRFFVSWNRLILDEPEKFDMAKTFVKSEMGADIDMIMELNEKVDYGAMVTNKVSMGRHLDDSDIPSIVNNYKLGGENGIGLSFIVESFDKIGQQGSFFVTFIDMRTKDVIFTDRVVGRARGIGFRNYWAGAIYSALVEIQKKKWKEWKRNY